MLRIHTPRRVNFMYHLDWAKGCQGTGKTLGLSVVYFLELGLLSSPALGHQCSWLLGLQTRLQLTPLASRFSGPLIWTELPHPLFWPPTCRRQISGLLSVQSCEPIPHNNSLSLQLCWFWRTLISLQGRHNVLNSVLTFLQYYKQKKIPH